MKGGSGWVNRERCASTKGIIKQIQLDQLRTVGAYTAYLLCAADSAVTAVCHTAAHS